MNKPVVSEAFADNGEHSHWRLINPETGELLWSEEPEEDRLNYISSVVPDKFAPKKIYDCFFDGSCEPTNPGGTMGFGVYVLCEGVAIEKSNSLPAKASNTNNVAEYIAFMMLMKLLVGLTDCEINIFGDSNMVINQMRGTWKIKDGAYVPYALDCKALLDELMPKNKVRLNWIPREQNKKADKLSKAHLNV